MIRLEPLAAEHPPLLRALVADPAIQRFTRIPVPTPPDFPERWLALGYAVVPGARGRGVATAALGLLTDWALSELGAERPELRISVETPPRSWSLSAAATSAGACSARST